tara:strand:- start:1493 stop:2254 length:762 start_codon:yes stop_codon:yes gene_type:complete
MDQTTNKFHALQLFTDTFAAETVHLTNKAVGIYIRLLCFAWTKNTKPFKRESAYIICQCIDDTCRKQVDYILQEFFKCEDGQDSWTHKRLRQEHEYLTSKYKERSKAGRKGGLARSKIEAPIPIPNPIPNNKYDESFETLWSKLDVKKGSKWKAYQFFQKMNNEMPDLEHTAQIYNIQIKGIENTYIPHFSTWLSQKRWENNSLPNLDEIVARMKKLGYIHLGSDRNSERFSKDGQNYKIDRFDEKHQIQLEQ